MNRTATSTTIPGVPEAQGTRLVATLNQNLANLTDLAAAYKQAHWNVTGTDFSQLHELFDRLTDQARDYMDVIAERAVTIGGTAHGTIQAAAEHTVLAPFPLDERDERRLLDELLRRVDRVALELRRAMDASGDELASQDVYIEVLRGIEKQRWMLLAHLTP